MAHDRAFKADRGKVLAEARRLYEGMGYGSLRGMNLRTAKGVDQDSFPGLDDVAERLAENYPEHFAGHGDRESRLFDMLSSPAPEPVSRGDAYLQAFDHLAGSGAALEAAPFARDGKPERYAVGDPPHGAGGMPKPTKPPSGPATPVVNPPGRRASTRRNCPRRGPRGRPWASRVCGANRRGRLTRPWRP